MRTVTSLTLPVTSSSPSLLLRPNPHTPRRRRRVKVAIIPTTCLALPSRLTLHARLRILLLPLPLQPLRLTHLTLSFFLFSPCNSLPSPLPKLPQRPQRSAALHTDAGKPARLSIRMGVPSHVQQRRCLQDGVCLDCVQIRARRYGGGEGWWICRVWTVDSAQQTEDNGRILVRGEAGYFGEWVGL